MIDNLYIVPSWKCNLHCPHCNVIDNTELENDKFLEILSTVDFSNGVVFGGEPLLQKMTFLDEVFAYKNVTSMSSNLLLLNRQHIDLFAERGISIATSWNPRRFNDKQYGIWLQNVEQLLEHDIDVTVLVTLTEDLVSMDISHVLTDLDHFSTRNFKGVKFEPFIPSSTDLIDKADIWLCNLEDEWKYNYNNILALDYREGNFNFCKNTWTLKPNGDLENSCPTGDKSYFIDFCLKCKYKNVCKPCIKQEQCTFFEKFYLKVKYGSKKIGYSETN